MSREERARARASWPIARFALGEEPSDDLSASTTPLERVSMVWRLTMDAWASAGKPIPDYDRANMPGRIIRGGLVRGEE